jgi:Type II secretion system (T2SS), protein G
LAVVAGLALLAALAFLVGPTIMAWDERGLGKRMARLDVEAFRTGFLLYRQDTGRTPKTLRDLVPLYVREVGRDPWNHEYRLEIDGGVAEFRSAGPNGRYGDDDDIIMDVETGKLR